MNNLILPQKQFPLLKEYKKHFEGISEYTIFAYDGHIYANEDLPDCLIVHEKAHLRQQEEMGLKNWVNQYLSDANFRLKVEIEAYKEQLKSIHNNSKKRMWAQKCAKDLSSNLYGNIISYQEALRLILLP
jgi:hypothetical protein